MILFFLFLAVLYLAAVFAATLPYWYERGNTPCEDIPSSPYTPRAVIQVWLHAAFSALLLGLAFPLDPIMRHIEGHDEPDEEEALPPVLLVHGLYHHPSGWLFLRRRLRKAGFRKIRTVAYSSLKTDMAAVTATFENAMRDLERGHPGEKPLLVGHSLGGLIIRNWLADAGNQKRARGVLTLGAPHRGSKIAVLACGTLGRSLQPADPFFADLARRESPAAIPCVSLVSEADTMVLPQQNLIPVTGGWTMRLAPYATHAGMMTRGAVMRMAAWELYRMGKETPAMRDAETPDAGTEPAPVPAAETEKKTPRGAARGAAKPAAKAEAKPAGGAARKTASGKKTAEPKKTAKK